MAGSPASSVQPPAVSEAEINELLLIAGGAVEDAAQRLRQGRSHIGGLIAKGDRARHGAVERASKLSVAPRTCALAGTTVTGFFSL
jgi:hypothetical protein